MTATANRRENWNIACVVNAIYATQKTKLVKMWSKMQTEEEINMIPIFRQGPKPRKLPKALGANLPTSWRNLEGSGNWMMFEKHWLFVSDDHYL